MYLEKQLLPFTNILKNSSKMINLTLVILLVGMLFPVNEFFPSNPFDVVENELVSLLSNPLMMTVLTLLVYSVFLTNNEVMLVLILFIIHRLVLHRGSQSSGGSLPPTQRTTPPPPKTPPPPPKTPPPPPNIDTLVDIPGGI
tara:strand:+ start:7908 stop:8333 length:426 start_codon:yes stop_codon:yes gene_type:complete